MGEGTSLTLCPNASNKSGQKYCVKTLLEENDIKINIFNSALELAVEQIKLDT